MRIQDIKLTPAELHAILEHQHVMMLAQGTEVSLETAIDDFICNHRDKWLHEKQQQDSVAQINEIEKHKYFRSIEEKRDIGKKAASEEWCAKYAHLWRAERESLERNGFFQAKLVLDVKKGLHLQPAATIARLAKKYDCEVYLNHEKIDYCNFILQGKKYVNVKTVIGLLAVTAAMGDKLEIISAGPESKEALEEIAKFINGTFQAQDIEGVAGIEP